MHPRKLNNIQFFSFFYLYRNCGILEEKNLILPKKMVSFSLKMSHLLFWTNRWIFFPVVQNNPYFSAFFEVRSLFMLPKSAFYSLEGNLNRKQNYRDRGITANAGYPRLTKNWKYDKKTLTLIKIGNLFDVLFFIRPPYRTQLAHNVISTFI